MTENNNLGSRLLLLRTALNTGAGLDDPATVHAHQMALDELEQVAHALESVLNSCGARGRYHALEYADAVEKAERILSKTVDSPSVREALEDESDVDTGCVVCGEAMERCECHAPDDFALAARMLIAAIRNGAEPEYVEQKVDRLEKALSQYQGGESAAALPPAAENTS